MSFKVTVQVKEPAPLYPRVMQHRDTPNTVVIFTEANRGLCISPADHPDFGTLSSGWVSWGWKPCCVTLDSTGE
jgi:hypothetical protein